MSLRKCNKHWQVREAVLAFILWYQWIYKELQYCKNHKIQLHIFSTGVITVPFWGCERAKGRFGEQLLLWGFASCSNTWKLSLPLIIAMFWCCLERLYIVFVIFHVCYCTSAFYLIFFSLNLTCQGNVQLLTCSYPEEGALSWPGAKLPQPQEKCEEKSRNAPALCFCAPLTSTVITAR